MKELSLFTGMGGAIYGSKILGWQTVAYVEKDEYCQKVIAQRQQDGWFEKGNIYGDITEFNHNHAHQYAGKIDVLTGGFPCQPFSVAGSRKGASDERYLQAEIIKTIQIIRPKWLFFENVSGLLTDSAIIDVLRTVQNAGYTVKRPLSLGSGDCGNIHKRKRIWILAFANSIGRNVRQTEEHRDEWTQWTQNIQNNGNDIWNKTTRCSIREIQSSNTMRNGIQGIEQEKIQGFNRVQRRTDIRSITDIITRPDIPEPIFCGMDDELPNWRKQLKAIGNAQDPIVMATAWHLLQQMD